MQLLESAIRPPIGQHLRVGAAKDEVVTIIDGTTVTADAEALVPGWDELIIPRDLIGSSSKPQAVFGAFQETHMLQLLDQL